MFATGTHRDSPFSLTNVEFRYSLREKVLMNVPKPY